LSDLAHVVDCEDEEKYFPVDFEVIIMLDLRFSQQ
jgi:hypothetical protein